MTAARLLEHFDRVAEAPGAVPKLRRFILDLAVRGKLVQQNPLDEPVAQFLRRTPFEHGRSVRTSLRNQQESPFVIPSSWVWAPLDELASFSAGRTPSRHDSRFWSDGTFHWVSIADMTHGGLIWSTKELVSEQAKVSVFGCDPVPAGSMLMSFKLTIGKISRLAIPAYHNEAIIAIRPYVKELDEYLFRILPEFARAGQTRQAIKGATLNRETLGAISLPIPPLAEQKRLVTKVDELMAVCDRLEAAQAEREVRRRRVAAASFSRLRNGDMTSSGGAAELLVERLPAFTPNAGAIRAVRRSLVSLAIRGALTRREASDEPAALLLRRIQADRGMTGTCQTPVFTSSLPPDRAPFAIPGTWSWVSLSELAQGLRYGTSVKCSYRADGEPVLRIPNISNGRILIEDLKFGQLPPRETEELRLQLGDILIVRSNGSLDLVGRAARVEANAVGFCYAGYLVRMRTNPTLLDTSYLVLALGSEFVRNQIEIPIRSTVGLKNINAAELGSLTIPLPPLNEQHRIVAKLDQLMSLCDRLAAQIASGETASSRLLDRLLHDALALPNAALAD